MYFLRGALESNEATQWQKSTSSFNEMDDLGLSCHEEDDATPVGDVGQEVEGLSKQMGRLVQVENAGVEPKE